jgi:hypothetical protein
MSETQIKPSGITANLKGTMPLKETWALKTARWCLRHYWLSAALVTTIIFAVIWAAACWHNEINGVEGKNKLMFDEMLALVGVLVGALFGLIGWLGSYVGDHMQRKISGQVDSLHGANTQLTDTITSLEEVIRCKIEGIPNILGRAVAIIEAAMDNVTLITFTPHLGAAHIPRFADSPDGEVTIPGTPEVIPFRKGVDRFWTKLPSAAESIPHVKVLTIPESRYSDFAMRLKKRNDYEVKFKFDVNKAEKGLKKAWDRINAAAGLRDSDRMYLIQLNTTESLPYQLLIAQLKPRTEHGKERWGCMVFLVGSGNIEAEQAAIGFYTELKDFVDIFKVAADTSFDGSTQVFPVPATPTPAPAITAKSAQRKHNP